MRRTFWLLQVAGWALAVAAGAAATKIWLDLRHERRLHTVETLPLDLTTRSDWQSRAVTPGRAGVWRISLTTVNAFSRPDAVESTGYNGALEVQLLDERQIVRWSRVLDGPASGHTKPPNMAWTELTTVDFPADGKWTMRARVLRGDRGFDGTRSEIRLSPPEVHDIGWYTFGESVKIVLCGVASLAGLAIVGTARLLQRRRGGSQLIDSGAAS